MSDFKKHPYYICAPNYSDSSAGIRALHLLCDHLNGKGFDAWLAYAEETNSKLNTPLLSDKIVQQHKREDKNPIAVYSDVFSGNPLGAPIAVRYMLNKEGVVAGNKINAGPDDLYFYYSEAFVESEEADLLTVPVTRFDLFYEDLTVKKKNKFLYLNRIPESAIDFSVFPDDIQILSNKNPLSLEKLAEKLKGASVIYSYELSGTLTLAMLCGCPAVVLNLQGYERLGFNEKNLSVYRGYGYCFSDEKKELEHARKSICKVREVVLERAERFEKQFDFFISKTQEKASFFQAEQSHQIKSWLKSRSVNRAHVQALATQKVRAQSKLSVTCFIQAGEQKIEVLDDTELELGIEPNMGSLSLLSDDFCKELPVVFNSILVSPSNVIESLNKQLSKIDSDWILLLSKEDRLVDSGLFMAQVELFQMPKLSAISFDEIYRQSDGSLGAAFRPSGNLDYLLSFPAGMSRHWMFNRKALLEIGGFNPELPDAFELDAILRLINKGGLECVGHIPEPLVIANPPALINVEDERKAIESHLHERGYADVELHAPNPGRYQVRYNHPAQPVVSLLIQAGKHLANLQRCVEGLLGNTAYQNFEILFIEQPSSSAEVKEWLAGLEQMQEAKLRVLRPTAATSAEQLMQATEQAIGDYLLLLSADTAMVSEHWLDEMLNHGQRGEVGVVGAKLLSAEGQIAHAGLVLGLEGPVGSPFVGRALDDAGYMQRLQVDQNLSAVSNDCMLVLKQLFVDLGGFDAQQAESYQSTDFCLRVAEAGFLTVWTPHAQLMLDQPQPQPQSDQPSAEQEDAMYEKWLPQLARDPAYNPNFSLAMPGGYRLADSQLSWRPLDSVRPQSVALVHPADLFGCGHYRVMQPFLAMKEAGLIDGAISTGLMHVTDLERYNPDTIILQRQIGEERLQAMQRMQKFSRAVKVYELDDYLPNLPLKSVHRKDMPKDILRSLRRGLSFVDRFVVSTYALAEAFSGLHGEIIVRENRLPLSWWDGVKTKRRQGKKPRVGWAGGSSHTGDLELIADVVKDLAGEVEWVFFGMCPEELKPYVHEFHGGVPIEQYPAKLASLNLDLGLAPLEHNLFNECKSNLRQLEYGACGIPIICTDIRPYQDGQRAGLPVTLVKNRYKDWVDAIRMHINDLDATAKMADELQVKVKSDWMLEGEHLLQWRDAWLGR